MGSWDETCAISGIGLGYNEPCVVMYVEPWSEDELKRFYFHSEFAYRSIKHIVKGTYDDYGYLHEYGQNQREEHPEWEPLFIHRRIWDHAVTACPIDPEKHYFFRSIREKQEFYGTMAAAATNPGLAAHYRSAIEDMGKVPEFMAEALSVINFAHIVRRPLLDAFPNGPQSFTDSVSYQLEFFSLCRKIVVDQRKRWKDDE